MCQNALNMSLDFCVGKWLGAVKSILLINVSKNSIYFHKKIQSKEHIFVKFQKFLGNSDEIFRKLYGLLQGSIYFQILYVFSPDHFDIFHVLNIDWTVLNLVALDNPLHLLDSGKSKGVMYLSIFDSILDLSRAKNFHVFRDSFQE